ncbi:MAG: hypothetical protein Tsb0016_17250 [Sphingomonadales bacterium]
MKILIAALGLSLAANLFVLGYWLGDRPWGGHHRHHGGAAMLGHPSFAMLRVMADHLQPAQQARLEAGLDAIKHEKKQQIGAIRTAVADIDALLRAETVDRGQLLASYQQLRDVSTAARQPFVTLVADLLADMDAQARRAFLDDLAQRRRDHWRKRRDQLDDAPPRP